MIAVGVACHDGKETATSGRWPTHTRLKHHLGGSIYVGYPDEISGLEIKPVDLKKERLRHNDTEDDQKRDPPDIIDLACQILFLDADEEGS